MLNFYGLVIGPKAEKKDTIQFGRPICNPWGANVQAFININVLAFISNLGAKQQAQKCSKLVPSFFWALTPSVKRA
jgi:hypothetical protein